MAAALKSFGLAGDIQNIEIDARLGGKFLFSDMRDGKEARQIERALVAVRLVDRAHAPVKELSYGEQRQLEMALAEAGLANRVEVAFYPEVYNTKGFQGVIGEIKKQNPGTRLHTLHGTDFGGMLVRQISDECGWIYPWRILRRDKVSATAIRKGAKGMTSSVVTDALSQISQNLPVVTAGGRRFRNDNGVLTEGA
jgi:hypothetical protein